MKSNLYVTSESGAMKTFGRPLTYKFDQNLRSWFVNGLDNNFSVTTYIESGKSVVSLTELVSQSTEKRFIFGMDIEPELLERAIENSCLDQFSNENCGLFRKDGSSVMHSGDVFLAQDFPSTHEKLKRDGALQDTYCLNSENQITKKTKFNPSDAVIEVVEGFFLDLI